MDVGSFPYVTLLLPSVGRMQVPVVGLISMLLARQKTIARLQVWIYSILAKGAPQSERGTTKSKTLQFYRKQCLCINLLRTEMEMLASSKTLPNCLLGSLLGVRSVINLFMDGTHTKLDDFKHIILIAVTYDGNNEIVILAYAVVDVENKDN